MMPTAPSPDRLAKSSLLGSMTAPGEPATATLGSIFYLKARDRWAFEYKAATGKLRRGSHPTRAAAEAHREQVQAQLQAELAAAADETITRRYLAGPSGVSVAQMLAEYAVARTCMKLGAQQELSTINRFLRAGGLPELRLVKTDHGTVIEKRATPKVLPLAFAPRLQAIRERQPLTTAAILTVANLPVLGVGVHHMDTLFNAMETDGLSDSTRQKLFALLRHAFNTATASWAWKGLINPCQNRNFSGPVYKQVVVTDEQLVALRDALAECKQPAYVLIYGLALLTALRPGSLLNLAWKHVDLQLGILQVMGKGRWISIPLSPLAVEALRELQRPGATRVFDVTGDGLRQAWRDARIKAGLPNFQFQDLRHVAATRLAENLDVFVLQKVLGHKSLKMALHYVNLREENARRALASAESRRSDLKLLHPVDGMPRETLTQCAIDRVPLAPYYQGQIPRISPVGV